MCVCERLMLQISNLVNWSPAGLVKGESRLGATSEARVCVSVCVCLCV